MVHLTRDDRDTFTEGGKPARSNFLSIITKSTIHPYQPHCLFNKKLSALPTSIRRGFKVSCFTEIPLDQIHLVTGLIKDRQVKLEPYGFVFRREFIIRNGGQPAIYVNSYDRNMWLRESMDDMFDAAVKQAILQIPIGVFSHMSTPCTNVAISPGSVNGDAGKR